MTKLRDFWIDLAPIFDGHSDDIQEIDLVNLTTGGMAEIVNYLLQHSKEGSTKFLIKGTDQQVLFASPEMVINYLLQGQVTMAMWLTLPALPMLSVYVDFADEISFGYVRGEWNALAVLAFFNLIYELKGLCPQSQLRPSVYTYTNDERELLMEFWQDYDHLEM
ncbi:MAG: hypothetical protein AAFV93_13520 [Chloroflexota bacterium]